MRQTLPVTRAVPSTLACALAHCRVVAARLEHGDAEDDQEQIRPARKSGRAYGRAGAPMTVNSLADRAVKL